MHCNSRTPPIGRRRPNNQKHNDLFTKLSPEKVSGVKKC